MESNTILLWQIWFARQLRPQGLVTPEPLFTERKKVGVHDICEKFTYFILEPNYYKNKKLTENPQHNMLL